MKKVVVRLNRCIVCGRMYHPNDGLVKSYKLLYLALVSVRKNVRVDITQFVCNLCKS